MDYKSRLNFVWPEGHSSFPPHFTLSRLLLYSPKTLSRIRKLIKNKLAFLIPGFPSNDDIVLANALKVPIYAGDP